MNLKFSLLQGSDVTHRKLILFDSLRVRVCVSVCLCCPSHDQPPASRPAAVHRSCKMFFYTGVSVSYTVMQLLLYEIHIQRAKTTIFIAMRFPSPTAAVL